MNRSILYLLLALACFSCGKNTTAKIMNNKNVADTTIEKQVCEPIDETKLFTDTTWFLPYADAYWRDTTRAISEQWVFHLPGSENLHENCCITLTLYEDSTYSDNSPCEWDFPFTGYYQYVCDTLYCVYIDYDDFFVDSNPRQRVQWLVKLIRKGDKLHYVWSKENMKDGDIITVDLSLVLEKKK